MKCSETVGERRYLLSLFLKWAFSYKLYVRSCRQLEKWRNQHTLDSLPSNTNSALSSGADVPVTVSDRLRQVGIISRGKQKGRERGRGLGAYHLQRMVRKTFLTRWHLTGMWREGHHRPLDHGNSQALRRGGGDTGWGQQRGHWAKIRDYVIKERTWFFNLTGHLRTVGFIIFPSRKGFRCHICLANVKQTEEFLSVFNMLMLKGEGYTISKSLSSTEFFGWMNTTPFGNQFGNVA